MIKDNLDYNKDVQPNTAKLEELKNKMPEYFDAAGNFDLDKLSNDLKENNVDELSSGYQLDFIGKDYAKKQAGERPTTVIVPDVANNKKDKNKQSDNLFFTGDNLEVLRHLQANYQNSIDFIYIDPPYNTGNDGFVYPDDFEYTNQKLKDMFDLDEDALKRLNLIKGKATHSAWLTFMYPRLYLAKKLLTESGIIAISIDENEFGNLKILLDMLFGESSYIGDFVRKTRSSANDPATGFNQQHEYAYIYGKNIDSVLLHGEEKNTSNYKNPDNDPHGPWITDNPSARSGGPNASFKIINPYNGHIDTPPTGRYWAFSEETFNKWIRDGKAVFKKEVNGKNRGFIVKKYLNELRTKTNTVNSLFAESNEYMNQSATKYLRDKIFEGNDYFSSPKPVIFVNKLIKYATNKSGIVLDFFAGSATTAEAVMQLNAEDGGQRKFIMATSPEKTYSINKDRTEVPTKGGKTAFDAGYRTIDEISRERIVRAAKKIREEYPELSEDFDDGFKHYRVVSPTAATLEDLEYSDDIQQNLLDNMVDKFSAASLTEAHQNTVPKKDHLWHGYNLGKDASGKDTILATWLVADGYKFDVKTDELDFAGYKVPYIDNTRLYLIEQGWSTKNTRALVNEIGNNKLTVQTIVVYGYNFDLESLKELKIALQQLDVKVNLNERF